MGALGSGASYHGTTCTQCSYVCPTNYYAKGSTWTDYKLTSTCTPKICNGDSSQKLSSNDCCTRTSKTCTDYSSSYKSSQPTGQTCTKVTPRSGLTCYKDCKDDCFCNYSYYLVEDGIYKKIGVTLTCNNTNIDTLQEEVSFSFSNISVSTELGCNYSSGSTYNLYIQPSLMSNGTVEGRGGQVFEKECDVNLNNVSVSATPDSFIVNTKDNENITCKFQ